MESFFSKTLTFFNTLHPPSSILKIHVVSPRTNDKRFATPKVISRWRRMTFAFEKSSLFPDKNVPIQSPDEIVYKAIPVILKAEELNSFESKILTANAINDLRIVK